MAVEMNEALSNVRRYAAEVRSAQDNQMEIDAPNHAEFEARLERTVEELQARVSAQQAALQKVRGHLTRFVITR